MPQMRTFGPNVAKFIEDHCTLNGSYAGQPFIPLPWMRRELNNMYKVDENDKRIVRTALLGVPRKSSKSTLGAALCCYHLIADTQDEAPQVWGAAGDRQQAAIVFNMTKDMIEASPALRSECKIYSKVIECTSNGGTYRVASADAGLAHGTNPSFTIFDEFHNQRKLDLYTALRSGSSQRNQPMTVVITTAGYDKESPLGQLYKRGLRINKGEEINPAFYMSWYGPEEGEDFDPYDESLWPRFMPSHSIMNIDEVRTAAKEVPENEFIRLYENGWTTTQDAWLAHGQWEACKDEDARPLEKGDDIVLGFDGSFNGDCTAIVGCRVDDLHLQKLAVWERPDNAKEWRVPVSEVIAKLRELDEQLEPREIGCDPFIWRGDLENLALGTTTADGAVEHKPLPIVEVSTNAKAFSADCKIFRDAVVDQELSHDGDPQMARHVANTQYKPDSYGYQRITKNYRASTQYIDITVAAVIAVSGAHRFRQPERQAESQMIVL